MLHCALIGLNARKFQPLGRINGAGQGHNLGGGGDATAPCPAVNLNQTFDDRAMTRGSRRKISDVAQIIDTANRARAQKRDTGQAINFLRVAHLIADQDIPNTAAGKDLGLAHLLATDTTGPAKAFLQLRHIDRFMHLAMHAVTHSMGRGIVAHFLDVALKRIEIKDQARGLDICLRHARQRGNVIANFQVFKTSMGVHALSLSSMANGLNRHCRL